MTATYSYTKVCGFFWCVKWRRTGTKVCGFRFLKSTKNDQLQVDRSPQKKYTIKVEGGAHATLLATFL